MNLPTSVIILGVRYEVTYTDNPSEVDLEKRDSLWGQIDYWTRTIRIYKNKRPEQDIVHSLLHEIFHAINRDFHFELDRGDNHDKADSILRALTDVLYRNGWIREGPDVRAPQERGTRHLKG